MALDLVDFALTFILGSRVKRDRQRAVSSDGVHTLSGWGLDRRPGGFQDPNVDEVLRVTDDMDYPRTVKDDWDQGGITHLMRSGRKR